METTGSTVEMQVPGLCCLECNQGIEAALRRTPGVHDLRVLGMAEKVVITYDAAATEPGRLAQVVTDAGHPVADWQDRPLKPRLISIRTRADTHSPSRSCAWLLSEPSPSLPWLRL
ncbi:MAG TPA: cation transporter [Ktedonobacteraceae bacterium]|jgi:copper chaperone CopZ|nr:cation transporter [Ktedonobacteraceae bacterium]